MCSSDLDDVIRGASLISLVGVQPYLKALYFVVVIATALTGVLILALQSCAFPFWQKLKNKLSLGLSVVTLLLFILGLQPYAAVFTFVLLLVKALVLVKR